MVRPDHWPMHTGSSTNTYSAPPLESLGQSSTDEHKPEDEYRQIQLLEGKDDSSFKRYILKSWWERWKRYAESALNDDGGVFRTKPERPGPVETVNQGDGNESVALNSSVYSQLATWYGTKPASEPIVPKKISQSVTPKLWLRFIRRKGTIRTHHFLPTATIEEVLTTMTHEMMPYTMERVYLLDPVKRNEYFLRDTRSLVDLGITDNTVFCLLSFSGLGRKSGKLGLANMGNTCYMNSSLQCLLHTPELMHYFLTQNYVQDVRPSNPDGCGGRFADEFYKLMRKAWDSEQDYYHPYQFWDILSKYYPLFAEKDQHDTAELAETVLDGLMEDCNLAHIPKPYYPEIEDNKMSDTEMAELYWQHHKQNLAVLLPRGFCFRGRSSSFITDHFHGQYRILTRCPECHFESRKFDSFTVLHLGLPPPKRRIIVFTLVEVSGEELPKRFGVELDSDLLVKDLYQKVAELLGCDSERPWNQLCFVLHRSQLIFLQLQDPIVRISDFDELLLYSYRGSEYGPNSGGQKTCFVHQKLVRIPTYSYCYNFSSQREEKQEFGYPLVLWLPSDAELPYSKKRTLLQGNLDILENSLRPFKRAHMAVLQEEEESKPEFIGPLNKSVGWDDASEVGSTQAQPDRDSSQAPSSARSDPDETDYPIVPEDENLEQETIPDAPVDDEMETCPLKNASPKRENEMEMRLLPVSSTHDVAGASDMVDEEESENMNIAPLFADIDDNNEYNSETHAHTLGYYPSTHSSPSMRFGSATSASDAYKLSETTFSTCADDSRTIFVDWDNNADQFYNLLRLEQPLAHPSAENVEERRRRISERVTIYDCLHHEFSPHPWALDGDNLWKCGKCKEMVNGVKSMRLWKIPDVLLIGLKRFDYCEARDRLVKLNQMVDFPLEGLDLRDYFASSIHNEDSIYDLYGVCHHHGHGPKVGHYTSTVKSPGGKWHKYNDSWVSETSESFVATQDAYLLYYRKRNLPFPSESEILEMFMNKEIRAVEDQAVALYQSTLTSDDTNSDDRMTDHANSYIIGKRPEAYKTDNGSSGSNDLNNENEESGLTSQVNGHGSLALCVTGGGEIASPHQASSSSAFHRPETYENRRTQLEAIEDTHPFAKESDEIALSRWQGLDSVTNKDAKNMFEDPEDMDEFSDQPETGFDDVIDDDASGNHDSKDDIVTDDDAEGHSRSEKCKVYNPDAKTGRVIMKEEVYDKSWMGAFTTSEKKS